MDPVIGPASEMIVDIEDTQTGDLGGDLGMDKEKELSLDVLAHNLGFRNHLPAQFNKVRGKTGLTAWESPLDPKTSTNLELHWHQLAGVHSIIRRAFTPQPNLAHCTATLECDQVGLGKTTLAITVIAFLNQIVALQEKGMDLPPILGELA